MKKYFGNRFPLFQIGENQFKNIVNLIKFIIHEKLRPPPPPPPPPVPPPTLPTQQMHRP